MHRFQKETKVFEKIGWKVWVGSETLNCCFSVFYVRVHVGKMLTYNALEQAGYVVAAHWHETVKD